LFKKLVFMVLLHLRKRKHRAFDKKSGKAGYGVKSHSSIENMDRVQPLCVDEMVFVNCDFVSREKCLIIHCLVLHSIQILN